MWKMMLTEKNSRDWLINSSCYVTERDGFRDLRISLEGLYAYEGISSYIHDTSMDTG